MLHPTMKCCNNCNNLKQLITEIDTKLYKSINDKFYNDIYNTENKFNAYQYKKLLRYKRVILNRIYNPTYPESVDVQDIITQITLTLNK